MNVNVLKASFGGYVDADPEFYDRLRELLREFGADHSPIIVTIEEVQL